MPRISEGFALAAGPTVDRLTDDTKIDGFISQVGCSHVSCFSMPSLNFETLECLFCYLGGLMFTPWVIMLVIQGSTWTPQGTSWVLGLVFE